MGMGHYVAVFLGMAVLFGVLAQVLNHPSQTNALLGSSVGAISTVVKANEGRA